MKRHIALLLAVVMCISFLPANFAAATDVSSEAVRTIYTDEMIENARDNIEEFSWAESQMNSAVSTANKYLAKGADFFWAHVTSQGVPRAYHLGMEGAASSTTKFDPDRYFCRGCGEDLYPIGQNYPWRVDPIANPWKITCPACGESFPSNDFGKFYELGMKNSPEGKFDRELALEAHREMLIEQELLPMDAVNMTAPGEEYTADWYAYYGYGVEGGFLHNDLHADKGDARWGVDDGFGYVTNGEPPVGDAVVGRVVPYIALYNHFANFQSGNNNLVSVVNTLGNAYMYTGNAEYGILGAIILDRFADNYPDYELGTVAAPEYDRYPNNNGGSNAGKAVGRIWECFVADGLAEAYDKLKPAFDEPEVIDFLEDKAAYYGIEGDKSSGDAIRANIEDGILKEIFDAAKRSQIYGNFGLHQKAVISAAIALDDEEVTPEMIDWVYASRKSGDDASTRNSGGEINSMLVDGLYRDGQNLESPSYNEMGISDLLDGAIALERYVDNGGYIGENQSILSHPKYLALINSFLPITIGRKGVPGLADAGTAASYTQWPGTDYLLAAFQVLKDSRDAGVKAEAAKIAQQLYERIASNSHYDIWTANPDSLYEDVCDYIDAYGEYDWDKSTIMTGYGYAVLRSGTLLEKKNANGIINTQGSYMLNFSGHNKHNHGDYLDLLIEAYGIGMTTDLGYPETPVAGDPHSQWSQRAFSHNTVVIDDKNHGEGFSAGADGTPQEPLHFDATSSKVQVVDARTPNAYANDEEFRRTVVMVNYDDEVSYGVDFFNVKGGSNHLYGFTPNSNDRPESNLTFGATREVYDEDSDITAYNTWMTDAQTVDPDVNNFYLDYQIEDFKGYDKNRDLDVNLRVTMLNDADEVSLVTTQPQRTETNLKHIGTLERFVVRRNDSESLFTAVYEPYANDTRYIANISEVAANGAKVVKVEFVEDRIDYIVYSEDKADITVTDGAVSFPFQGFVGVYSVSKDGAVLYSYVNDGSKIGAMTDKAAAVTGTVVDFQKEIAFDNYVDIAVNGDVDVDALEGRMFIQEDVNNVGNAAYVIESAEDMGDTIRLNLGNVSTLDDSSTYILAEGADFTIPMSYENSIGVDKVVILKDGVEVSEINAFAGETFELDAKLLPAGVESAINWASDKADVATVEDGVVTINGTGTANITATAAVGGRSGKVKLVVLSEDQMSAATQKFVTTLAAFNTANMLSSDKYSTAPVLRFENNAIYFRDAMSWKYEIPAEYAADKVAFQAMNLEKTAPWELVANGVTMGSIFVNGAYLYQEFSPHRYVNGANYVVLRLHVANKGEYILKATGSKADTGAAPATYFFKDEEDIDYTSAARYPADSQLKYFDLSKSGDNVLGRVSIDYPGDYIIAFVADETSAELNSKVASNNTQAFSLTGIELIPTEDDAITGLSVSSDKTYLVAGEELPLDVKLVYEIFGEDELREGDAVEWKSSADSIATVENGVVKAQSAGKVTITATSGDLEQSVDFTVVAKKEPYEINYMTHFGAFNMANFVESDDYAKTPTIRTTHKILYYHPVMHWDYVVPAEYSATGEAFQAMNLEATAPWALENHQVTVGSLAVYNGQMRHEANYGAFWNGDTAPRLALRLFVDAPGEYLLKVRANTGAKSPVPAVYFFKDGVATNNAKPSTYPAATKVGYADFTTGASNYRVIGTVKADEVGEYIISFVCDSTSATKNPTTGTQTFDLRDIMLDPVDSTGKLSYNFTSEAFNYDQMKGVSGIVSKVTDNYYYRDLAAELGWTFAPNAVMIMNEALANPATVIPAGYYGAGKPATDIYAMDTTEGDGDAKGTDKWAFAGANAVDAASSPIFQIRGSRETNGDGLHPYFDMDKYTDGTDTQFYALSLEIPAAGEYIMNVDAGRGTGRAAPAVYFFKDTGATLNTASFITSATKLGYINSADTAAAANEYFANVTVPEAGKYIVALVMDTQSATLAPTKLTAHGVTNAQYIQLYGIDLTPLDRGELAGISFKNANVSVAAGSEKAIELVGQYADLNAEITNLDGFKFAVEGDAAIVEDGVIKGVKEGTAVVTATYGDFTATVTVNVFNAAEQTTLEYVTTLGAFNTDKMLESAAYTTTPTLRASVGIYFRDMMNWTYEVPAEYSATGEAFMAMDTTEDDGDAKLTDKWAYVGLSGQSYRLIAAGFLLETKSTGHYLALKIDVPAAGEYFLQLKGGSNSKPTMATYFFKDGTAGVTNTSPATWKGYEVGNFNSKTSSYVNMAKVNVTEAGEYIVGFLASNYPGTQEDLYLTGIKLIPTKDDVFTGLNLTSNIAEVHVGESAELSIEEIWQYSGLKNAIIGDYTFTTDATNISLDGNVVTGLAISENPAIITATHKNDAAKTATIAIKVVPYAEELEYIIGTSAFNTATMIEGDAYTTTPVLRTTHRIFYYQPAMHWDYVIPAEYTSDNTPVKIMNLEATAPWAFEAARVHVGSPALYSGNMTFEMKPSSYTTSTPSFISFKLKVAAPGNYELYTKANRSSTAPVPAVYFNDEYVGHYDIPNGANAYVELGTVTVPTSGEYIITFMGDATSLEKNPSDATQTMQLLAMKLVPVTGMDPNPPVVEEAITSISLEAAKTQLLEEEKTQLTVKATTESGVEAVIDPSEVTFSVDPAGAARVTAAGVVTAYREGTAVITATLKDDPTVTATIEIEVFAEKEQRVYEFVTSAAAFNTDKMQKLADYSGKPVIRDPYGTMHFTNMFNWTYEVPAEYSNTDPQAAFVAMDTTVYDGDAKLTDKWAYASASGGWGSFYLGAGAAMMNAKTANFGVEGSTPYMALRLNIDAAGEYFLNLKGTGYNQGIASAVYFFKEGTAVTYNNLTTYPAGSKVGRFNMFEGTDYVGMGTVNVATPGDYILVFAADAESLTINDKTYAESGVALQDFRIAGVQLVPTEDDVLESIEVTADKQELTVGQTAQISIKEFWSVTGEKTPALNDANSFVDYTITNGDSDILTVYSTGQVIAKAFSENPVKVTVQHKVTGLKGEVEFRFAPDPTELEYIIGTSAFNTATMIEGDAYTTTPVLRPTHRIFYYRTAMHWDYEIPAEYTSDNTPVKAMNLEATAPWAYESHMTNVGSNPALYSGHMAFEYKPANFASGAQHIAFRLKVAAPGDYYIQAKAVRDNKAPVPTVYFNNEKVGSFDIPNAASAYATVGKVTVAESGEYVISFVGDATSAEKNPYVDGNQTMNLNAIKLIPAEDNALTAIDATISDAELFKGETATISINETFSVSGTNVADLKDYKLDSSDTKVVTVVDYKSNAATAGTVTAVGAGEAVITITHRATGATAKINVKVCPDPTTLEYVTTLGAFNTDKMVESADYGKTPTLRAGVGIYYTPMIDWAYEVPAEYSKDNAGAFMAMDTTEDDGDAKLTDKWAYAHQYGQSYRLVAGGFLLETKTATHFLALKVDVPAPGEYFVQLKGGKASGNPTPTMDAYFFKDGAVSNIKDSSTWKAYKVGVIDTSKTEYTTVATIEAPTSGSYIVGLVAAYNTGAQEDMLLSGIKLIPTSEDVVSEITLSASATTLGIGEEANLAVEAAREYTGAFDLDIADVEFTVEGDAVEVANGVVTAVAAGKATVTATYGELTSSVEFTVVDFANAVDHEYVIDKKAFNTDLMKVHSGTNPTNYEYTKYAVIRSGCLYYRPAMSWKYVQEKIDSEPTYDVTAANGTVTTYDVPYYDLETPFNTMNLDVTDKWELISYNFSGNPRIQSGGMFSEVPKSSLTTAARHIAFRVVVEEAGEYEFFAKGSKIQDTVVETAVYFFKDGAATNNSTPSSYPADSKMGRFMAEGGQYKSLGTVKVFEPGEYIVSFVVDDEAIAKIPVDATNYVETSISGIQLKAIVPEKEPEMIGIEIVMDPDVTEFEIGDEAMIYAVEVWSDGRDNSELIIEDGNIFTVDPTGVIEYSDFTVTAVGAGEATITAEYEGFTDSITVTVLGEEEPEPVDELQSIALTATPAEVEVGDEIALAVTGTYSLTGDKAIADGVTYTVAPEGAVVFSGNVATAAIAGSATITAEFEGKTATATVEIAPKTVPATEIVLTAEDTELTVDDVVTYTAVVLPDNTTDDTTVEWTVEGDAVTVDGGVVTAVKAGTATVKVVLVANPAIFKTVEVTVKAKEIAATGITLDKEAAIVGAGGTVQFTATVIPPEATGADVVWSSDNDAVATVNQNGLVTTKATVDETLLASGGGIANITVALADNPEIKATATVKVVTFATSMQADLMLESEVFLDVYFRFADDVMSGMGLNATAEKALMEELINRVGLLVWDAETAPADGEKTIESGARIISNNSLEEDEEDVVIINTSNSSYGPRFETNTGGIPAKKMGDLVCFRPFFDNGDGTYTYGRVINNYAPTTYCKNQINNATKAKDVCIALLNYGAAAQVYFNHKTDSLMNSILTADQQKSLWDESLVRSDWTVPAAKEGSLGRQNPPINSRTATLILEGKIISEFSIGVTGIDVASVQMMYWTEDQYNKVDVLTEDNISGIEDMKYDASASKWRYESAQPAKEMFKTVFACAVVTDKDGNKYYGGVLPYSPERYGYLRRNDTDNLGELAKRMVVYGDAARTYFN